eukprot:Colp12_sorted_trinity150504_noHs@1707
MTELARRAARRQKILQGGENRLNYIRSFGEEKLEPVPVKPLSAEELTSGAEDDVKSKHSDGESDFSGTPSSQALYSGVQDAPAIPLAHSFANMPVESEDFSDASGFEGSSRLVKGPLINQDQKPVANVAAKANEPSHTLWMVVLAVLLGSYVVYEVWNSEGEAAAHVLWTTLTEGIRLEVFSGQSLIWTFLTFEVLLYVFDRGVFPSAQKGPKTSLLSILFGRSSSRDLVSLLGAIMDNFRHTRRIVEEFAVFFFTFVLVIAGSATLGPMLGF